MVTAKVAISFFRPRPNMNLLARSPRTTLFLEGCVSVSLQFLYLRHLMPEVGSSILVTTLTVSIFLLALSLGYLAGGRDPRMVRERFAANCMKSAVCIAIGLSPLTSLAFFYWMGDQNRLVSLTFYCIVFMAPAVFWLGQTMPLLSNEIKATSNGDLSGRVLFFSTIGNVLGGLISILVLMSLFGLGVTVFINIVVLAALWLSSSKNNLITWVKLAALIGFSWFMIITIENESYLHTNAYANYAIKEVSVHDENGSIVKARALIGNKMAQSLIQPNGKYSSYNTFAEKIVSENLGKDTEILVAGSGGFTFGRRFDRGQITFVDIDASIKNLSEKHFLMSRIKGEFVAKDARLHLIDTDKRYDYIIMDTFLSQYAISAHLITREYFELAKSRTKVGGKIIINTVADKEFRDDYSRDLHTTITSVFPYCSVQDFPGGGMIINRVYVCRVIDNEPVILRDRYLSY